jgi:hypothetical protein
MLWIIAGAEYQNLSVRQFVIGDWLFFIGY